MRLRCLRHAGPQAWLLDEHCHSDYVIDFKREFTQKKSGPWLPTRFNPSPLVSLDHQQVHPFIDHMDIRNLPHTGVALLRPRRFSDARGYFAETYSEKAFAAAGITARFVQDNQSFSAKRGTVRGLHFQLPPAAQAKLVRVLQGSVYDVAVDLRAGSPTYGRWDGETLTAEGGEQLFVPRGFAHAFCTLEPDTLVAYKVDAFYAPECDSGLIWNDPTLAIQWPIAAQDVVLSDKDLKLGRFADFVSPFTYEGN